MTEKMTYASAGVDYEAMDPFKRLAQQAGRETTTNILRLGYSEVEMSRGESAYLRDAGLVQRREFADWQVSHKPRL